MNITPRIRLELMRTLARTIVAATVWQAASSDTHHNTVLEIKRSPTHARSVVQLASTYREFLESQGETDVEIGPWMHEVEKDYVDPRFPPLAALKVSLPAARRTVRLAHKSPSTPFVARATKYQLIRAFEDGSTVLDESSDIKGPPFADHFTVLRRIRLLPSPHFQYSTRFEGWVCVVFKTNKMLTPRAMILEGTFKDVQKEHVGLAAFIGGVASVEMATATVSLIPQRGSPPAGHLQSHGFRLGIKLVSALLVALVLAALLHMHG